MNEALANEPHLPCPLLLEPNGTNIASVKRTMVNYRRGGSVNKSPESLLGSATIMSKDIITIPSENEIDDNIPQNAFH